MFSSRFKSRSRFPTGFTLPEMLVTAVVLVVGIMAVQTTIQFGVRAAGRSIDGLVAAHLAEEGIELIRNVRDTNWAIKANGGANTTWTDLASGAYLIHYPLTVGNPSVGRLCWIDAGNSNCPAARPLNFDTTSKLYGYSGWRGFSGVSTSRFTRVVTITNNTIYIQVSSQVQWNDASGSHDVTLVEHLYDWRP